MGSAVTPDEAADVAVRTMRQIDYRHRDGRCGRKCAPELADRERVASDLAGLRRHQHCGVARQGLWATTCIASDPCDDAEAFEAGLRRTAALYGVTP